eukprot:symbB.v1.2.022239.t1/scaffold1951.1/size99721/9
MRCFVLASVCLALVGASGTLMRLPIARTGNGVEGDGSSTEPPTPSSDEEVDRMVELMMGAGPEPMTSAEPATAESTPAPEPALAPSAEPPTAESTPAPEPALAPSLALTACTLF